MKNYILASILLISNNVYCQVNDSLVSEICKTLDSNHNFSDTIRLEQIMKKHIFPILEKIDSSQQFETFEKIEVRLQRNCKEYKDISDRLNLNKGDWVKFDKKPTSILNAQECQDFISIESYNYLETSGDTVHVTIKDGVWEEHFIDGTFSKLKFYWIKDCEFEIEFIESNNILRKNYSHPGDKYRYQVLEKFIKYYTLSVEIPSINQFLTFKMYY